MSNPKKLFIFAPKKHTTEILAHKNRPSIKALKSYRISLLATGFSFRRYTPERTLTVDQIFRFLFALAYFVLGWFCVDF